jgi:hypothetical protein
VLQWVEMVWFNLFEEEAAPYPILATSPTKWSVHLGPIPSSGISGCSRCYFTMSTRIDGEAVGSLLLSSGKYAAMRMSDGLRATGQAALAEETLSSLTAAMVAANVRHNALNARIAD